MKVYISIQQIQHQAIFFPRNLRTNGALPHFPPLLFPLENYKFPQKKKEKKNPACALPFKSNNQAFGLVLCAFFFFLIYINFQKSH